MKKLLLLVYFVPYYDPTRRTDTAFGTNSPKDRWLSASNVKYSYTKQTSKE